MDIDLIELTRLRNLDKECGKLKELCHNQAVELRELKETLKEFRYGQELLEDLYKVLHRHGWEST